MKTKFFLVAAALLASVTMMAAIGPQSVKVTFNGSNSEGWVIPKMTGTGQTTGTITSVEDGYVNITMGVQNAADNKYCANLQYNNSDDSFTFDRTKDVIWAIKLKADISGTGTNKKFELGFKDSGVTKYTGHQGGQSTPGIWCADGGKVYYFDLSSNSAITDASTGILTIEKIQFIFADAVITNEADAKYSVDWIATFQSVNDLTAFIDWTDEAQEADPSLPYYEACFRPKADGSGYDKRGNGFGTRDDDQQFEGNYYAHFFAVEYFLIEDFSAEKIYTLALTTTGSGGTDALSVWDFPYQVNYEASASDMNTNATAVVGYAPGTTGSMNPPIATSTCNANVWSFSIPADKLTALATIGTKTLVGVLVTSNVHDADKKGKFASASHASINPPSLTIAPIVNTTQGKQEATLAEAVSNANANDVITIYKDVAGPATRMDIAKELTIQGATGAEKITCAVADNSIMVLANGEGAEHTVTFKNLVIDGNNVSRSIQTLEAAQNANICLNGVQFVNTAYSQVTGDVKNTGNKNIVLKNTNVIPNGIYLNKNKCVKHEGATHTSPIKIVLANDYVPETYSIVLTCSDPTLYTAELANGTAWQLFKKESQNELAGRTMPAHTYDLTVSPVAGMATLVLGFDAELPEGVKAYKLEYNEAEYVGEICAYEETSISKNKPVLIIAEPNTYTFTSATGVALDEQANPTYGALKGVYASGTVPACTTGVYNYILTNGNDGVGFYQVADATNAIGAHRAYLSCGYNTLAGGGSAPRRMVINFDAHKTPTAVDQITNDQQPKAEKLLIDGVIYIRKADHLYRIDGQLVK